MLADGQLLGRLMNCTCIDLHGKYSYDTGIKTLGRRGWRRWGCWQRGGEGRRVCADFIRMQIVGSRLGIDKIGCRLTEPQKLEINCRRHMASHYSEADWPCSTLSQSISYYNHANCGQIKDLTYWYYIPVQPTGYASLLGARNNMYYAPL